MAWLVIARGRGKHPARITRACKNKPRIGIREVAVRVSLDIPDEAFDPLFVIREPATFELGDVLRPTIAKEPNDA